MKHTFSTPITIEKFAHEQMKKAAWHFGGHFHKAVQVENSRMPKSCTPDTKTHMTHGKEILNSEWEKRYNITANKQSEEASSRHTVCDNQLDCIVVMMHQA